MQHIGLDRVRTLVALFQRVVIQERVAVVVGNLYRETVNKHQVLQVDGGVYGGGLGIQQLEAAVDDDGQRGLIADVLASLLGGSDGRNGLIVNTAFHRNGGRALAGSGLSIDGQGHCAVTHCGDDDGIVSGLVADEGRGGLDSDTPENQLCGQSAIKGRRHIVESGSRAAVAVSIAVIGGHSRVDSDGTVAGGLIVFVTDPERLGLVRQLEHNGFVKIELVPSRTGHGHR